MILFCVLAEAISCLLKAIEIYTDMGRFTMAAKHHQSIAEIYESEAVDLERAVHHYEQAADYFRGEESNSSANKCLLKVAQYAAQLENYDKAIQIYEQVTCRDIHIGNKLLIMKRSKHGYVKKQINVHCYCDGYCNVCSCTQI